MYYFKYCDIYEISFTFKVYGIIFKNFVIDLETDLSNIIDLLGKRNLAQRREIGDTFRTKFDRNLMAAIRTQFSRNYKFGEELSEKCIRALFTPLSEFYARQLISVIHDDYLDYEKLFEHVVPHTNDQIRRIAENCNDGNIFSTEFSVEDFFLHTLFHLF